MHLSRVRCETARLIMHLQLAYACFLLLSYCPYRDLVEMVMLPESCTNATAQQ